MQTNYLVTYVSVTQSFTRYLNYKKDNNELLLYILRQLMADQNHFQRVRYGGSSEEYVQIKEKELVEKVGCIHFFDIQFLFLICCYVTFYF